VGIAKDTQAFTNLRDKTPLEFYLPFSVRACACRPRSICAPITAWLRSAQVSRIVTGLNRA